MLMDISKAGYLPHDLAVAKLEAYGLAKENLQLISDYLSYRKQMTKIDSTHSDWAKHHLRNSSKLYIGAFTFQYFY